MERLSKFRRMRVDTTVVETNTAACWATRCGCSPAPTDSLEPIPSVDAEKRGDRKGEPDERQYDHCNSNDKRPEHIFARSLRRRVDRVELPVQLIESFDNVIHRITSCTPAGRRIHPVSTDVSPPRKNMTAFVWARAPVLFLPVLNWFALLQPNFWRSANALHVQSRVRVQRPGHMLEFSTKVEERSNNRRYHRI